MERSFSPSPPLLDKYFALLIAGVALASLGVWKALIPFGDEGGYIWVATKLAGSGAFSPNLFFSTYALMFRTITGDPVIAHLLMRFAVTLFSTVGLYLVLTSFRQISHLAALIACLIWASSTYVNPYAQGGNINVFAFALMLPGLAVLLRYQTLNALLLFVLGAVWVAIIRPEYYAPLVLVSLCGAAMIALRRRTNPAPFRRANLLAAAVLCLLLAASVRTVIISRSETTGVDTPLAMDNYLLLGLGQHYGLYYQEHHPQEHFSPWTEYQPVLDKVFGNPHGFFEALRNNPAEAARFFAANGTNNLIHVVPSMVRSLSRIKTFAAIFILAVGTAAGLRQQFFHAVPSGAPAEERWQNRLKVLALAALTTASPVAILLLGPERRYWISCMPLLYLWLAWSVDRFLGIPWVNAHRQPAAIAMFAIMSFPPLLLYSDPNNPPNQMLIRQMRESVKGLCRKPVIVGDHSDPWAAFTFGNQAVSVETPTGFSPAYLKQWKWDIFISHNLAENARWQADKPFLAAFEASPEHFGYRELKYANGLATGVYVRAP